MEPCASPGRRRTPQRALGRPEAACAARCRSDLGALAEAAGSRFPRYQGERDPGRRGRAAGARSRRALCRLPAVRTPAPVASTRGDAPRQLSLPSTSDTHGRYRIRRFKQVVLARLDPPYREVLLTYANSTPSEGNWLPWTHEGRLYVTYSLCPHRVLAVDTDTGVCTTAYLTERPGCRRDERGSASGVRYLDDDSIIGLGHFRSMYGLYSHFFFQRSARPPFAIMHVSRPFRFHIPSQGAIGAELSLALPSLTDSKVQFALSLRRCPASSVRGTNAGVASSVASGAAAHCESGDLLTDIGASDAAAFTTLMTRHAFCHFTHWCDSSKRDAATARSPSCARPPAVAPILRGPLLASTLGGPTRTYAIVIKGPLLAFTEDAIDFYARTLAADDVAIVFSHTNGSCFTTSVLERLRQLAQRHANFAWTIVAEPLRLGESYRNVQRESTYYGARFAADAFDAQYVFMQRADSVFQAPNFLADLAQVLQALPPPSVPMPGGRIGFCPTQLQLTDTYGAIALPAVRGARANHAAARRHAHMPSCSLVFRL